MHGARLFWRLMENGYLRLLKVKCGEEGNGYLRLLKVKCGEEGPSTDPDDQDPVPGPSSRQSDHQSEDFAYLSLSQIDCDILKELPDDIAQEVLTDLTRRRRQRDRSDWSDRATAGRGAETDIHDGARGERSALNDGQEEPALPSLSQLNMSCFEALPAQLQAEIRAEYAWQEKKASGKNQRDAEENYFTRLTSPRKDQKSRGSVRGTGHRGRRGRPPGKKKLSFPGNRAKNSDLVKKTSRVAFSDVPDIIVCDDEDENTNDGHNFIDEENTVESTRCVKPSDSDVHGSTKVERASLCGAVSLSDVRALVKEWLSSGSEPQDEDLTLITEYLTRLIEQRNLELVFPLLKLIHRNSITSEHDGWRDCLQNLVTLIQSLMCAAYGACFKL
ncbi:hypothetical protein EGW08_019664 [Elysia chlorotica]|uniref:DNA repair protein Rev1 C-terminal domain-containing protein n=1 Tax=Elysia chlorotica TaxID=188477 RepID=A0A3S0ZDM1_ELYCH|nr:hypothetical protein EGW08_019664 [Elysia chlorotica]